MSVLWTFMLMKWCVLNRSVHTKTFNLVLAISRGLQTVTEMIPAINPETKSWIFLCLCWSDDCVLIALLLTLLFNVRFFFHGNVHHLPLQTHCLQNAQIPSHLRYLAKYVAPLSLVPQLIAGGIFFSFVDVGRRIGI